MAPVVGTWAWPVPKVPPKKKKVDQWSKRVEKNKIKKQKDKNKARESKNKRKRKEKMVQGSSASQATPP